MAVLSVAVGELGSLGHSTMKRKIVSSLATIGIIVSVILYLWWDADRRVQWEQKYVAVMTKGDNPFELVFRWNEVTLNPFTWKKPSTDKLVIARPKEVVLFQEERLLLVRVLVMLNTRNLKLDPSMETTRYEYRYDLRGDRFAMVATDVFGVPTEKEKYEPLAQGPQAQIIRDWAEAIIKSRAER